MARRLRCWQSCCACRLKSVLLAPIFLKRCAHARDPPTKTLLGLFFGGREGAADAAVAQLNAGDFGLKAVGALNPGFGSLKDMSSEAIINEINAANADFVLVALGAAKGQAWIEHNRARLNCRAIAHLGAVVDFTGGGVARAPKWMQRFGFEWLWRIKEDPGLWRRYFFDGLTLLRLCARALPVLVRHARAAKHIGVNETQAPSIEVGETRGDGILVRCSGAMVLANRDQIRAAFRKATAQLSNDSALILDLSAAERIDLSFLGQVLMLEKQCLIAGATLNLRGASKTHDLIFALNNMHYRRA